MAEYFSVGIPDNNHVHFVGIGGAGMSGLAEVLHNLGYQVSGSDLQASKATKHLQLLGINISLSHDASQINGCDMVVFSNAIIQDNPELIAARDRGIPVIPRAAMLAKLMQHKYGIAIAGTHGKTTTTSLVASLLAEGGLDPTYVIGGLLNSSSSHARLGSGKYLVAEADESDASFLLLEPNIAILTNIDADHLEGYGGDFTCLQDSFITFLQRLPADGLAVICADDEVLSSLINKIAKPCLTYGFTSSANYHASRIHHEGSQCRFYISRPDCQDWLQVKLNLFGIHNILNALAAVAVAHELGVDDESIIKALLEFQGIARRCQVLGYLDIRGKKTLLVDDYAHHPSEIKAILQAVRASWPGKPVTIVFQPHRHTRTRALFKDFCQVLSETDNLLLLDIYSAGEKPIPDIDSQALCRAIQQRGQVMPIFVEQREVLPELLADVIEHDALLLVLGAGDISLLPSELLRQFEPVLTETLS